MITRDGQMNAINFKEIDKKKLLTNLLSHSNYYK